MLGSGAAHAALLPALKRARGRIVNVSSIAGEIGYADAHGLLRGQARDGRRCPSRSVTSSAPHGIQVALVEPGGFRTRFARQHGVGRADARAQAASSARQLARYRACGRMLARPGTRSRAGGRRDRAPRGDQERCRRARGSARDARLMRGLRRLLPEGGRARWSAQPSGAVMAARLRAVGDGRAARCDGPASASCGGAPAAHRTPMARPVGRLVLRPLPRGARFRDAARRSSTRYWIAVRSDGATGRIVVHRAQRRRVLRADDAARRERRRAAHVRAHRRGRGDACVVARAVDRRGARSPIRSTASSRRWSRPALRSRSRSCCRSCSKASGSCTTRGSPTDCRDAALAATLGAWRRMKRCITPADWRRFAPGA